jgi:rfaE bifunctional protein nucleotidyltransferase chain/domain
LAVVSQAELILQRAEWKRNGKRVVCAAGAFDLLHPGHVRRLEQARALGDVLIVGVQSDAGVRAAKPAKPGKPLRPIHPAAERSEILAALEAVDSVAEFDAASPRDFIVRVAPEIFVLGGTANANEVSYLDDLSFRAAVGKVVRIPLEPGYSTSLLLDSITHRHA